MVKSSSGFSLRRKSFASSRAEFARRRIIAMRVAFASSSATFKMASFESFFHCNVFSAILAARVLNSSVSDTVAEARMSKASRAEWGRKVSSVKRLLVASCCFSLFFRALNL